MYIPNRFFVLFRSYWFKIAFARIMRCLRALSLRPRLRPILTGPFDDPDTGSEGKIVVVDHSFHKKTRSSGFFLDAIKGKIPSRIIWDEAWKGGVPLKISDNGAMTVDALIFWQTFYYHSPREIRKSGIGNVIAVPMYDDTYLIPDNVWRSYHFCRFITFSSHLHERLQKLGLRSRYFQYFPDPSGMPSAEDDFTQLRGFFWQRTNDITWNVIRKLIGKTTFSSFHLHMALDSPWYKEILPTGEEMEKYRITITRWFDNKEDYLAKLRQCNVFFAPRLREGIGMPFLEAMAMGKVVVAPDLPAMNEYIAHGTNGFLYGKPDPVPLDKEDLQRIAFKAREDICHGFQRWERERDELIPFILNSGYE